MSYDYPDIGEAIAIHDALIHEFGGAPGLRALDKVFRERLWRSVKYENIYLNQYDTVRQL